MAVGAVEFREALGGFGPVLAYEKAMQAGMGRALVAQAAGIGFGSHMPSRRAAVVGREQGGMEFQTRVLPSRDGGEIAVVYAGNQPAAVAAIALKGTAPNAAYEGRRLDA